METLYFDVLQFVYHLALAILEPAVDEGADRLERRAGSAGGHRVRRHESPFRS